MVGDWGNEIGEDGKNGVGGDSSEWVDWRWEGVLEDRTLEAWMWSE